MGHARSERRPAPVALLAIAIAAGCAAEEPDPGRFMDTGWIVVASRTDGPDAESHVLEMPHAVRWTFGSAP